MNSKRREACFLYRLIPVAVGALLTLAVFSSGMVASLSRNGSFLVSPAEAASTIFVDISATGSGTGASWTDAKTSLQDALEQALSGDQVWVAAGVYYPDEGSAPPDNDPLTTFTLKNGVEIYGGFAGTETALGERDWDTNVTVLSGDIDQNDTTDPNGVVTDVADIAGTNAYHVVTGGGTDSSAVLDGFTITAGRANDSGQTNGAGMYNASSSPTLVNLIFSGNWAGGNGGGLYNSGVLSASTLMNVSFTGNTASGFGGGMANGLSHPTLMNVGFSWNQAGYGGGMHNNRSSPVLTNVSFSWNEAIFSGGGMYNDQSSPTLTNLMFSGNWASNDGGGLGNDHSSPTLTNVTFSGNRGSGSGGGMDNYFSNPILGYVTFTGNKADYGGGMGNLNSNPWLNNAIFWNNQASFSGHQIYNDTSTPEISYSDIQGSGGSTFWNYSLGNDGGFNIDADPLFVTSVDPAAAPTAAGDLHPQADSPVIDAGNTSACPVTDLDGSTRPIDGDHDGVADCDIGAYEKLIDLFLPFISR